MGRAGPLRRAFFFRPYKPGPARCTLFGPLCRKLYFAFYLSARSRETGPRGPWPVIPETYRREPLPAGRRSRSVGRAPRSRSRAPGPWAALHWTVGQRSRPALIPAPGGPWAVHHGPRIALPHGGPRPVGRGPWPVGEGPSPGECLCGIRAK